MLAAPLVIGYGLMPLLDALIGEDRNNPPEAVVPQLEADTYYRWLTWLSVPLYFLTLLVCAWWAGTQALPWWAFVILAYAAGANSGMGLTTGHELGHKHNAFEQWLAKADPRRAGLWPLHGRARSRPPRWVSTPEDHASARAWARASTASRCASCPAACGAPGRWSRNGSCRAGLPALEPAQHHAAVLRGQRRAAARADRRLRAGDDRLPRHPQRGGVVAAHLGQLRRALRPAAREAGQRRVRAAAAAALVEYQPPGDQPGAVPPAAPLRPPRQPLAALPEPAPLSRPAAAALGPSAYSPWPTSRAGGSA